MRVAMIAQSAALRERMSNFSQVNPAAPEAEMPPYMESFLAHLRLLIGVPFVYLIPDAFVSFISTGRGRTVWWTAR
jgi:hypothetical protein